MDHIVHCRCAEICYRNQNAGPDSPCQQKSSLSERFIMKKFDLSIAHFQCSPLPLSQRIHLRFLFASMKQVCLIVVIKLCERRRVCYIITSHELISDVPGHPSGKLVASLSCPAKPHLVNVLQLESLLVIV